MRLLIAEDNPAEVRLILESLSESGVTIGTDVASTGPDVEEHLRLLRYDLVLLDINLPCMSGIEVLETFRGELPSPVVVLSTSGHEQDRQRSLRAGALAYYQKPSDFDHYLNVIGEICSGLLEGDGLADPRVLSRSLS